MSGAPTTFRGLAILAWTLVFCFANDAAARYLHIDYVQGILWPTDLYSFQQVEDDPIDVAVLGSSRASFAFSPAQLDRCLSRRVGRDTHTVNLARSFATGRTMDLLARDLLDGARLPKVLVLLLGPEALDSNNHRRRVSLGQDTHVWDVPASLATVRGWDELVGALRPVVAGTESLTLFLARRHLTEDRLRWMMVHFGGGQFCGPDNEACEANDTSVAESLSERWAQARQSVLPTLVQDRYADPQITTGYARVHLERLLDWANERAVQVVIVPAPFSRDYEDRVPAGALADVQQVFAELAERPGVTVREPPNLRGARAYFIDPDHLNREGGERLAEDLCKKTLTKLLRE